MRVPRLAEDCRWGCSLTGKFEKSSIRFCAPEVLAAGAALVVAVRPHRPGDPRFFTPAKRAADRMKNYVLNGRHNIGNQAGALLDRSTKLLPAVVTLPPLPLLPPVRDLPRLLAILAAALWALRPGDSFQDHHAQRPHNLR